MPSFRRRIKSLVLFVWKYWCNSYSRDFHLSIEINRSVIGLGNLCSHPLDQSKCFKLAAYDSLCQAPRWWRQTRKWAHENGTTWTRRLWLLLVLQFSRLFALIFNPIYLSWSPYLRDSVPSLCWRFSEWEFFRIVIATKRSWPQRFICWVITSGNLN